MITEAREYKKACRELQDLESRLERLLQKHPGAEKGLTKAGIRKMIARLQEELALYEGTLEVETKEVQ